MFIASTSYADNSCQEKVNCQVVKKKLNKEELSCFAPHVKVKKVYVEKIVYVDKVVYVDRPTTKTEYVTVDQYPDRNSVSLLGLATPTGLKVESSDATHKASTYYQPDLGLMYQRDLTDSLRGTIGATLKGNAMLGLGYNF